jgi:hypothetical protein
MTKSRSSERPLHSHPTGDSQRQRQRFIETARRLGCNEDEEVFKEKLKRIAKVKQAPKDKQT